MSNYHDELRKGHETAKIRSRKQAIITALLQDTVIAIAIFNGFPIIVKILIFVVLSIILGGIMSSKWIQSKWETSPKKKKPKLTERGSILDTGNGAPGSGQLRGSSNDQNDAAQTRQEKPPSSSVTPNTGINLGLDIFLKEDVKPQVEQLAAFRKSL